MKIYLKNDIVCWLPTDEEIGGNTYFKRDEAKRTIKNIELQTNSKYLVEPNYGGTGCCAYVRNTEQAACLNPFATLIPRADGVCAEYDSMKKEGIGLFMRTADCLALCVATDKDVRVLHISVETLNNGILMNLPISFEYAEAVLGPCICAEHLKYNLTDSRIGTQARDYPSPRQVFKSRTSHYDVLGYESYATRDEEGTMHVDIKGIVKDELKKAGIPIVYEDTRCTVCNNLGSHRLANNASNTMVVYGSENGTPNKNKPWSKDEMDLLFTSKLPPKKLAKILGRTVASVYQRRNKFKNKPRGQSIYEGDEKLKGHRRKYNKKYYARTQNAPKGKMPWTDREINMILSKEKSDSELSVLLGRSVAAIQKQRWIYSKRKNDSNKQ